MRIGVTGATGFLGRYIVNHLLAEGNSCRCWYRPNGDRGGFDDAGDRLEWIPGELNDAASASSLVDGVDAVVHGALYHLDRGFRGSEGDLIEFLSLNVLGAVRLIREAKAAGVGRFVFISTCAVHEVILDDRPLDETHPLWPTSHYGAHKGAIEKFVHSFGLGEGYNVCSLRPTGIYGLARPPERSKWYDLVHAVAAGKPVDSTHGGKEVHAADVARAVSVLLRANGTAGQAYNCYDMYISDEQVAQIARRLTGSRSEIVSHDRRPRHEIQTGKLRALGMTFGGTALLEKTVEQMLTAKPAGR